MTARGSRQANARVAKRIADAAREERNAEALRAVFEDGIDPSQPMSIRLKAAQAWIEVEKDETALILREQEALQEYNRDDAIAQLAKALTAGATAEAVRAQLDRSNVIDGHAVEVDRNE